jgi:hypothetical protein
VILLETLALYGCIRIQKDGLLLRPLLLCAACVLLLIPFRFYAAYIIVLTIGAALIPGRLISPGRSTLLGFCIAAMVLVVLTGRLAGRETVSERSYLNQIQSFRTSVSTGGAAAGASSGIRTADIRTPQGMVLGTLVGAAHLLLAPFPWQLGSGSLRMALTLPELVAWWYLVFRGLIPGVRYVVRHRFRDGLVLGIFILGFGLLYSLMFGNIGLVFRQRAQLLPWLLIVAAVGLERRKLLRLSASQRSSGAGRDSGAFPPSRSVSLDRGGAV